jgi:hypothetical protein
MFRDRQVALPMDSYAPPLMGSFPYATKERIRGVSARHIVTDDILDDITTFGVAAPKPKPKPPSFRSRYNGVCCMLAFARRFR